MRDLSKLKRRVQLSEMSDQPLNQENSDTQPLPHSTPATRQCWQTGMGLMVSGAAIPNSTSISLYQAMLLLIL